MSMSPIFSNIDESRVIQDPFPHIVVRNAIPSELADRLIDLYPSMDRLQEISKIQIGGNDMESHPYRQLCVTGKYAFQQGILDDEFRDLLREVYSYRTFQDFLRIFRRDLEKVMPERLPDITLVRESDLGFPGEEGKKIIIDGGACAFPPPINPPSPSIHLENAKRIGGILLYLKRREDVRMDGELQLFANRCTGRIEAGPKMVIKERFRHCFEKVKVIPYEHNTLFAFISSPQSFHAVAPRTESGGYRYTINVGYNFHRTVLEYGEYRENIFDRKKRAVLYYVNQAEKRFKSFLQRM